MNSLPLQLNDQVKRLARQLLEFEDEYQATQSNADFRVVAYLLPAEKPNEASEDNVKALWDYLEQQGAIKLNWDYDQGYMTVAPPSPTAEPFTFRQEYWLKVLDTAPINELLGFDGAKYDSSSDTLYVNNVTLRFRPHSLQAKLMGAIFNKKALDSEWTVDELLEEFGYREDEQQDEDWRKVYGAAKDISKRVGLEAQAPDLFITTTSTVRLNPIYAPKIS